MNNLDNIQTIKHKILALFAGPLFLLSVLLTPCPDFLSLNIWYFIGVLGFMLTWWLFEPVNSSITALLPAILFPTLGILDSYTTFQSFGSPYIFMFLGGYFIALALEKHQFHYMIASKIIATIGTSSDKIILAVILTTYCLSMWVSNTAVTIIMLPIALSIINNLDTNLDEKQRRNFIISILIGIAYAATIGGTATLVGSPPNIILKSFFQETFNVDVHFLGWLCFGVPLSGIMITVVWVVLTKFLFPSSHHMMISSEIIKQQINGDYVSKNQKIIAIIFALTILAWTLRPLYESFLTFEINDELIAITSGLLLFIIPINLKQNKFLLEWQDTQKLPWGIILLFGSGIAISNAINSLEIFGIITTHISIESITSKIIAFTAIIVFTSIATEIINNTSLSIVMIPLVSALCIAIGFNPLVVSIMVVMLISSSFILTVGTPPNSLIFINNYITGYELMRAGIIIKLLFIALILLFYYVGIFDIYKIDFEIIKSGNSI